MALINYFRSWFKSFGLLDKTSVQVNAHYSPMIAFLRLRISKSCRVELTASKNFYDFLFEKKLLQSLFYLVIFHVLINSDFNRKLGREVWNICLSWIEILSIFTTNCLIPPYFAKTKDKSFWRNLLLFLNLL